MTQEEATNRILDLLPIIDDPAFVPCQWPTFEPTIVNGKSVMQMPYPIYSPEVDELRSLFFVAAGSVDPYGPLPEDPTQEGIPFSVGGTHFPLEYFATATLHQVHRYLKLASRGEHFCDGHIAGEFESGCIQAALRRLKELSPTVHH
jgi:hypothetical protein